MLSPIGSPRIATDPVLLAVLCLAPSHDLDSMSANDRSTVVSEHSSGVVQELLCHHHAARYRASGEDLGLDLLLSIRRTVLANLVSLVVLHRVALSARRTVHAAVHVVASLVLGLVHLAGLVGNTLLVGVFEHARVPSSRAGSGVAAVDHLLHRQLHGGPRSLAHQVHAVSHSRGRCLCPAGAAVLRNVLVLLPGGVVHSVDVADVVALGNVLGLQVGVGTRRDDVLLRPVGVGQQAGVREVLRSVHSRAHLLVRHHLLGDARHGPLTVRLDAEVVLSAHDAEPALLSPEGAPRVATDPVLLAVLLAPANHRNRVVQRVRASGVTVDASLVLQEIVGHGDGARDRTTGVDLLHHVLLSSDASVLVHVVLGVVVHGVARSVVTAVAADVDVRALHVLSHVAHAALLGKAVVMHVLEGGERVASLATIGVAITIQDDLGSQIADWPLSLSHQLQTVGDRRGRGKCPAGSTILRDVLILCNSHVAASIDITTTYEKQRKQLRIIVRRKFIVVHESGRLDRLHQVRHTSLRVVAPSKDNSEKYYTLLANKQL